MLGAIVGDIVGSVYEWDNIKTKDFPFFSPGCFFTDDTVMTVAIGEGLLNGGKAEDFIIALRKYGRLYPGAGYGARFADWLRSAGKEPYNSWGNGSAMRVSPVAWAGKTLLEVEELAAVSAAVTHNHPEGIKGAQATAAAIFLARVGKSKGDIKAYLESKYGYNLGRTLAEIRPLYRFNESCPETVPEAICAFWKAWTLKMQSATRFPWAGTATPWQRLPEVLPKGLTEYRAKSRKGPCLFWTRICGKLSFPSGIKSLPASNWEANSRGTPDLK